MVDTVDAVGMMDALREQLDIFGDFVHSIYTDATVYEIDLYQSTDGVNTVVPDEIMVRSVGGKQAVDMAVASYRSFSRRKGQDHTSVYRLPGVIRVDRDVSKSVGRINNKKKQLKNYLLEQYPNARARNTFCKTEFQGRVMLQVYRKIYCNTVDINKISYSWSPFSETTRRMTKSQAAQLITRRINSGMDHMQLGNFQALKIAMQQINSSPDNTAFVIRKPRQPYPVANISYTDENSDDKRIQVPMSVPFILHGDDVPVGILGDYKRNLRGTQREDRLVTTPVYNPLYLHRIHH